ncbi:hypothetical protein [Sansalvadorimonas verongulae]|uniref:hypothetical protein n=1 Tax=Sansalvadorimonas verongulae TaxID=2172824 RepID=UPI0012BC4A54|nr:hypothetical protein [Sansalvadorimonas verongulae]MTI13005.1 hypothetical protein [Sansalvadorimonas verongulae]
MEIKYNVKRGKKAGSVYVPHKQNGKYVVSKTRFQDDYIFVDTYEDILNHLKKGYKVRVSDPTTKSSPSLVNYESLEISD